MNDKELIRICLEEMSRKSGYADPNVLRQRDFEYMSDEIEKHTGTLISISTLKRLLNGQFNQLPQAATLNAITAYLGYNGWQEFRKHKQQEEQHQETRQVQPVELAGKSIEKKTASISKKLFITATVILLFLLVASLTFFSRHNLVRVKDVTFSVKKTTQNDVPNTVVFSYDVENIPGDSFFIQQSWDRDRRVKIDKHQHTLTDIYYEPGYHNAKLIINDQVVKTIDVSIPTKGWFFFSKPGLFRGLPTHIQPATPVKNGVLSLTPADITAAKVNINLDNFYYYTLFPDKCNISTDSFRLKARIRFRAINNTMCPMIVHEICGQHNSIYFFTTLSGCTSNIGLNVGEHLLSGKTTDLSGFGGDIKQWQDIEVLVKDKQAHFYINNKEVFSQPYTQSAGLVTGLAFMSNGLCEIDHVSLKGLDGKVMYEDEF